MPAEHAALGGKWVGPGRTGRRCGLRIIGEILGPEGELALTEPQTMCGEHPHGTGALLESGGTPSPNARGVSRPVNPRSGAGTRPGEPVEHGDVPGVETLTGDQAAPR